MFWAYICIFLALCFLQFYNKGIQLYIFSIAFFFFFTFPITFLELFPGNTQIFLIYFNMICTRCHYFIHITDV